MRWTEICVTFCSLTLLKEGRDHNMKQTFTASIWQEDEWFVAQCVEVDVASQGKTEDEALDNLQDALELHFTPPVATLAPRIRSLEIEVRAA
jgi:hypothetical protein